MMNINVPKRKEAQIVYEVSGGGYCGSNVPILSPCLHGTIFGLFG